MRQARVSVRKVFCHLRMVLVPSLGKRPECRDRKHQGLRRGIPLLPHPWDGRFWVTWRAPRRSKSDVVPARPPHSRRPPPLQTHPSAPVTHPAALQALATTAARAGGPRAARSSPARTLPVSGPRTTARSSITRPQVGHAAPMTSKVRHSSVLQGTWRDRPRGALVRRRPTPGGGRRRRGGRGRTARCQRWREARTPAYRTWLVRGGGTSATSRRAAPPCRVARAHRRAR